MPHRWELLDKKAHLRPCAARCALCAAACLRRHAAASNAERVPRPSTSSNHPHPPPRPTDYSKNEYDAKWSADCWWSRDVIVYGDSALKKDHPVLAFLAADK